MMDNNTIPVGVKVLNICTKNRIVSWQSIIATSMVAKGIEKRDTEKSIYALQVCTKNRAISAQSAQKLAVVCKGIVRIDIFKTLSPAGRGQSLLNVATPLPITGAALGIDFNGPIHNITTPPFPSMG